MATDFASTGIDTVNWVNKFALGGGFDTLACSAHTSCVQLTDEKPHMTTPGQQTNLDLRTVENSAGLAESLNVTAKASARLGSFSGDAKASFAAEVACNSSSLLVVARVTVEDRTEQFTPQVLQNLQLTPTAAELLEKSPWQFQQIYGTHWVFGQVFGGELFCVVEIKTESAEDKKSLALAASGKSSGIEGSTDLSAALKKVVKGRNTNVHIYQSGGEVLHLDNADLAIDRFIDRIGSFPEQVAAHPMPLKALLAPYAELPQVAGKSIDLALRANAIDALVQRYLRYRDALADLHYLEDHQVEFTHPKINAQDIARVREKLEQTQDAIRTAITQLSTIESPDEQLQKAGSFPTPESLMEDLPQRRARLPRSAADIHDMYPEATDGEYDLYLGGQLTGHVRLYCHDLQGKPAEYVTLHSTNNYSEWPASRSQDQRWRRGSSVRTTYQRIRISGHSGLVDVTDHTFATTVGGPLTDTGAHGERGATFTVADYATASASNHQLNADRQDRQPFSTAELDLAGTGLRMDEGVVWRASGYDLRPSGEDQRPHPSSLERMSVTIGGAPGRCAPQALRLVCEEQ